MIGIPFFQAMGQSRHVLLAGAGGGFDVFASLPMYWALRQAGKQVSLANLSFTELRWGTGERISPACVKISRDADGPVGYFPERYLAEFLGSRGDRVEVYAIERVGCRPVREAYAALLARLKFDTLVLVDGGTDSLMRGDEQGIGTPEEDAASLLAAQALPLERKYHACIGFGVDHFHGVCNGHALEAIAELTRAGAFLGAFAITPEIRESQFFKDALEYAHDKMPGRESIVNSSILSAIEGQFGNHHATKRTKANELKISALMAMYWTFKLNAVAERLLYRKMIAETETYSELSLRIEEYRAGLPKLRPYTQAVH